MLAFVDCQVPGNEGKMRRLSHSRRGEDYGEGSGVRRETRPKANLHPPLSFWKGEANGCVSSRLHVHNRSK